MIRLTGISKVFETEDVRTTALCDVELQVGCGEFVAVMGPSGSGKSTLLAILGLIDRPSAGRYLLDDQDVADLSSSALAGLRRRYLSFVFQSFNLIDELTVAENIALPLMYAGLGPRARERRCDEVMAQLGITHRSGHRPLQLSGGQQQRVAIARAIAPRPRVILADEPAGNLDSAHGAEVMSLLSDLSRQGTSVLMVTHSLEHAAHASRTVHMRDGRVFNEAPPR